ncbi:MAG: efflux RND transporter periplasmic adaptor subunit [Opitutales bacterium]
MAPVLNEPLVRSVELIGTVNARRSSTLSVQVAGLVETLHVDVGSRIEAGQPLLAMDKTLAVIRRDQTEQAIAASEAELEDARRRLKEAQSLVERGGVPETELQSRQVQVRVREAQLAELRLSLREQNERVDRHSLVAPFSGIVSERHTQVGEWITPGSPVLELVGSEHRYFDIRAPQDLYPAISRDTEAEIRLDLVPDDPFPGSVDVIVPYKDETTRTFLVRITPEGNPRFLLPGASGSAHLFFGDDEPRLSVPGDALVRQPDGSFAVWVVNPAEAEPRAEMRTVQTGRRINQRVEVLSGVEAGEQVIVRGNENLIPGQPVRIVAGTGDSA